MRAVSIIAVLLLLVANAVELLLGAGAFQPYLSGGALALGLVALITILVGRGQERRYHEVLPPRQPDRRLFRRAQIKQTLSSSAF